MSLSRMTRDEDGAVAVIVAICTIMLFGFGALAVDLGNGYARTSMSQKDADFSALAGAGQLSGGNSTAIAGACDYLLRNMPPTDSGTSYTTCDSATFTKLTNGDNSDGEITVSPDGTMVTVWTPNRQVSFGLANAIGFSSTQVHRTATAGLFSPGSIMPLAIPGGCATYGMLTVKTSSNGPGACDNSTGDFGFLDVLRQTSPGTWQYKQLEQNLRYGITRPLSSLPVESLPVSTTNPCLADGSAYLGPPQGGTYSWDTKPNAAAGVAANCVHVETGNVASIITNAFVEETNKKCDGRLEDAPATARTRSIAMGGSRTCMLDGRRLSDFLMSGKQISDAVAPGATSVLDASIVTSPNFFVIPVLNTQVRPPNADLFWQIAAWRGFFIDCAGVGCSPFTVTSNGKGGGGGGNNIVSITGYSFDLTAINGPYASKFTGPRCNCPEGIPLLIN